MATITLATVTAFLFTSQGGWAQSEEDVLAAARACSQISDDVGRLACLDAALGMRAAGDEPVASAAEADEAADVPEAPAAQPPPAQTEAVEAAPAAAESIEAAPAVAEPLESERRAAAGSVEVDLTEDAVEATPSRSERRRERRRAAAEEVERTVTIVEIRRSGVGVATFIAQDGEVWVERSASAARFPPVPFDAVLRPAMGDSYFLISAVGSSRARVVSVR